jgi:hypothetical protein
MNITQQRLTNHHLSQTVFTEPAQAVAWLGAVQAQDFAHARHAVGIRCVGVNEAHIFQAIAERTIVRTWAMRGTLHLIAAADVRWLVALVAPFVMARAGSMTRQLGLDGATLARSNAIIQHTLAGKRQLTRQALLAALEKEGFPATGQYGSHLLYHAALTGLMCLGEPQGKQDTYTLLDEWLPPTPLLTQEEALAELARRYFQSHGPATVSDFVSWAGLPVGKAREGIIGAMPSLFEEEIEGKVYLRPRTQPPVPYPAPTTFLLPGFDEYLLGYKDRSLILAPQHNERVITFNGIFRPTIVVEGEVVGTWQRAVKKKEVVLTLAPFAELGEGEYEAVRAAAITYGNFLNLSITFT